MALRTFLVAIGLVKVLASGGDSGPCPADFTSQIVSSRGEVEDVETLDLTSMIQVSVTQHYRRASWNSSKTKGAMSNMSATKGHDTLMSADQEIPSGRLTVKSAEPDVEKPESVFVQNIGQSRQQIEQLFPLAIDVSPGMMVNGPNEQLDHAGIEVQSESSEKHSGPITVRSMQQQQREQQEVALFIESLAEEMVHDFVLKIRNMANSAWRLPWATFSYVIAPSKMYLKGSSKYFDGDPRVWSCIAYSEVIFVALLAVLSLLQQRKHWQVPHLQTAEVQLVISLAVLALVARIQAQPPWCLAVTLGLRYFVEGYMLFVALYILPSTLGRCMAEAQIREQRRAAEYFVMEGGGFERDYLTAGFYPTPPLLDVAIKQQEQQPEISAFPTSLPPMPSFLIILLCVLRPLLGVSCAMTQQQSLAMPICFWLNTWLIVCGLVVTGGLVRNTFSQIAQYVPTCEIVALSVGILPLLGGLQDVGLCGSLNSEALSYAGMLYLHEVSAMSLFVMYMIAQGAHFPTDKILCVDQTEQVARWQCWLHEVLNPYGLLKSLQASRGPDSESTVNDKRISQDFHSVCGWNNAT